MTEEDLQTRLTSILAEEEVPSPDWNVVAQLCEGLDRDLDDSGDDVPEIVAHFLSDSDIRARDPKYGDAQREAIRLFTTTGEFDDGVTVPWWGCAAVIAIVGGIIAWMVI